MRIACLSDLHLRGEWWPGSERSDLLPRLTDYCQRQYVDHIIICGDIVRTLGDPNDKYHFTPLRTKLKGSGYYNFNRCTVIPGNHDYQKWFLFWPDHRNPWILRDMMLKLNHRNKRPASYRYPFIKVSEGVAIIGINTISADNDNSSKGDFTKKRYLELRRLLKIAAFYDDTHIIVAMHHPPWDIRNYEDRLLETFEAFKVNTVVFGHEHQNAHHRESGTDYYCVGGAYEEGKLLVIDIGRGQTARRFMR